MKSHEFSWQKQKAGLFIVNVISRTSLLQLRKLWLPWASGGQGKDIQASQVTPVVKNPPANPGDVRDLGLIPGSGRSLGREDPWVGKIPWRRAQQSTPVFFHGESQGQRSLAGYGPQGHRVGHDWSDLAHTHEGHPWLAVAMGWISVFPPSSYVEIPNVMEYGDGVLRRWLGQGMEPSWTWLVPL